jgi:hypothetical protein
MSLSRAPQKISKTAWYYENAKSIDVVVECRAGDKYHRTIVVRIPAKKLAATLKRMGPAR